MLLHGQMHKNLIISDDTESLEMVGNLFDDTLEEDEDYDDNGTGLRSNFRNYYNLESGAMLIRIERKIIKT